MTGAGVAAIVAIGASPAMAGLMGKIVFGEKLGTRWYLSTATAVAGGILLVSGGSSASGTINVTGVLLALFAGFAYAVEGVGFKMIGQQRNSFDAVTAAFIASSLFAPPLLATPDSAWIFSWHGLLIAFLLSAVSSALAFTLFSKGLLIVGLAKSYTLSLSEPMTA